MNYDLLIMILPWVFPAWIMLKDLFGGDDI